MFLCRIILYYIILCYFIFSFINIVLQQELKYVREMITAIKGGAHKNKKKELKSIRVIGILYLYSHARNARNTRNARTHARNARKISLIRH